MDARYHWRCLKFTDEFINNGDKPWLSNSRVVFNEDTSKVIAFEATAQNGAGETVTHRFQPREIDTFDTARIVTGDILGNPWFNPHTHEIESSVGFNYDNDTFWINNYMQLNKDFLKSTDFLTVFAAGRYIHNDNDPEHY